MPAYDTTSFIAPGPRGAGWYDVTATVTWTPRPGGDAVSTTGAYLDANRPGGEIFLGCGIEELTTALGLPGLLTDPAHVIEVCDLVNAQLLEHPHAELTCPAGRARLELVRP
ncbi:hypothetical protein MU0083_001227 [[Mycobacterium] kokjensenii]|uniref:Uncharacterized protein n=1 Tax=[Mycobacterium] kokjensenii TaxID=3064287 RepID=A0ABM9LAH7_9MYCO|nr:hypothetical protein [Mycolicibacter sp. MU0083]CAJ1495701.1 hypothetical protein MU0083_001227 [Mycolicibacter sp. MU0083]